MCAEAIGGAIAATTRTIAKTARLNDGTTVWPARIASPLEVEELGATPLRVRSVVPTGQRAQTSAAPEDNPGGSDDRGELLARASQRRGAARSEHDLEVEDAQVELAQLDRSGDGVAGHTVLTRERGHLEGGAPGERPLREGGHRDDHGPRGEHARVEAVALEQRSRLPG